MARRRSDYNNYYDDYFEPSRPVETGDGIKARSQRGSFAKNWWAQRWITAMERLMDSGRLVRGRSYARKGQVLSITETKTGIEARVQGSRAAPYRITLQVKPLSDGQWEKVIDALSEQAVFTAQLLAGEMPPDIEEAFKTAGVSLFPDKSGDLTSDCSCPDWANPCKHVAATHYILGDRFDDDPFLLFRLRGRTQEKILQGLRQRRAGQENGEEEAVEKPETVVPLEETIPYFWTASEPLEQLINRIKSPAIDLPVLRRLGQPAFISIFDLQDILRPTYQKISQSALDIAYHENGVEESEGEDS